MLTISDKIFPAEPKNYPYYNVESLNYPTYACNNDKERINSAVKKAVKSIGVPLGPCHVEVIHNDTNEYVIDFGARGGGGHIFSLIINQVTGINAVQESVRIFLGEEPHQLTPKYQKSAIYRYFQNFKEGKVKSIQGIEDARKIVNVADLDISVKPGDVVTPLKTSTQRLGFVVTIGDTRSDAEATANSVANLVKIEIDTSS